MLVASSYMIGYSEKGKTVSISKFDQPFFLFITYHASIDQHIMELLLNLNV